MPDLDTVPRRDPRLAGGQLPARDARADAVGGRTPAGAAATATFQSDAQRLARSMAERGWTVPDWPKDYGGGGLSPAEAKVLKRGNGAASARARRSTSFGISMLGPALLKYGTEEQKKHTCRRSRAARSAGARAIRSRAPAPTSPACRPRPRTRATTGWSTARRCGPATPTRPTGSSAWCAPTEAKHEGISFLLFDMATPGVSTRPILLISGNSPFCETFFDDVKVPKDQVVGEVNKGWDVAKYLLGHEREMISGMGLGGGQIALGKRGAGRSSTIRCCAPRSPPSTSTRSPSRR